MRKQKEKIEISVYSLKFNKKKIMKMRKILLGALCATMLCAGFVSCEDDEDDSWKDGSKMNLSSTRAYILDEGKQGNNNAKLTLYDWSTDSIYSNCIYKEQNGQALGDVGNDLVKYGNDMLVAVNGSNYVALLNGSGVEKARVDFGQYANLGLVRDVAASNGYVYVSSYGGYVTKFRLSNNEFTLVDSLKVGNYPEDVLVTNGRVYCAVSGWSYDNRVAVIDANDFDGAAYVTVMQNPDNLAEEEGHVYVQGYGPYDESWNCPYPWGEINPQTGEYTELGYANAFTTGNGHVYTALSVTDWTTYLCNTTLTAYDVTTGKTATDFFKNAPATLTTTNVYGLSVNPYNGDIYVCGTDFVSDGVVFVFDKNGAFKQQFSSNGVNPKAVVFFKN